MSAMSDELEKRLAEHEVVVPNTFDATAITDWWGIKLTKAIYEFTSTGTTTVNFSTMDIAMVLLLMGVIATSFYLIIRLIIKKQVNKNIPALSINQDKNISKVRFTGNKPAIALSIVVIILFSFSYHQDQEIKMLKQDVEYQKWRVQEEKKLTSKTQERCDELARKLDEAQTPVQVVYSNPNPTPAIPSQQEQAYTDMLNKINRNLDQQYYDSVFGGY
ncbi:MAG: hypothetical protein E7202_11115 [Selenomonas ruminantium]|nr:hypothetical protein [Selenomonas ruminantium]